MPETDTHDHPGDICATDAVADAVGPALARLLAKAPTNGSTVDPGTVEYVERMDLAGTAYPQSRPKGAAASPRVQAPRHNVAYSPESFQEWTHVLKTKKGRAR
jgi:hypothetical protein